MFVTVMNPAEGMEDLPARRHKTAYPISFADGHAESFRFSNDESDTARLRSAATLPQ
jgi:prepilin-type processing-associated H-X9-DG protein